MTQNSVAQRVELLAIIHSLANEKFANRTGALQTGWSNYS
jgi:hypothetical protein